MITLAAWTDGLVPTLLFLLGCWFLLKLDPKEDDTDGSEEEGDDHAADDSDAA